MPENGRLQIEGRGAFAAILSLANGAKTGDAAMLEQQVKVVAGRGFEPLTFRL